MFLGLPDPHPDSLVTSTDQAKIVGKPLISAFLLYHFFTSVPDPGPYVFGPPGSTSGSVRQRYGSEDPDPYQNVTQNHITKNGKDVLS
jgi:hypothetical protein